MNKYQKMLKVLLFKKCRLISNSQIRKFTVLALKAAPDYFWTEPASTSGKHHIGESLVEHVLFAVEYGKHHIRMFDHSKKRRWQQRHKDIFFSALILHDIFRSGFKDRESRDKEGKLRTDDLHTIYAPRALKYINLYTKENPRYARWNLPWKQLEDAMACHYGPWSPLEILDPLDREFQDVALQVFLVDYIVSRSPIRIHHPEIEELRRNDDLYQVGEIEHYGIPKWYPENTKDVNRHNERKEREERMKNLYGE